MAQNKLPATPVEPMEKRPKKHSRYYGVSFCILLLCNFIYMIPHFEHYNMGGMQGIIMLFFIGIFFLAADLILLFPLAALLRWAMAKNWAGIFQKIGIGALVLFFAVNVYRSTLPLPYLRFMIDKIPDAVVYFEEHEGELLAEAKTSPEPLFYYSDDFPIGPMVNMQYVYVENPEDYPQKTGKISRSVYIHPIDPNWFLFLYQGSAI